MYLARLLLCTSVNTKTYIFQNPNDPTIISEWRRVAFVENFFDILTEIHCKEKEHIGTKKTLAEVLYHNLTGHTHAKRRVKSPPDALPSPSKKRTNKKRPLPNSPSPKPARKSRRVNKPSTTQLPPSKPENQGETKQTAVDVEEISETSPQPDISKWIPTLLLDEGDKKILEGGRWLNNKHMYAAQHLLKSQFPHISGLQPTVLGKAHQWAVMTSEGVPIINQSNSHWICVSTIGCAPDTAYFYNSMLYNKSRLRYQVTKDIASLIHAAGDCIDVMVPQSQLQEGADDCGLFTIATATSLCFGIPPNTILWDQKKMREHFRRCFENGKMSPFPGWDLPDRTKITPHISYEPLLTTVKVKVYCSRKMPQIGRERMAQRTKCLK